MSRDQHQSTMSLAEFEGLVDIYGSDTSRWPLDRRVAALSAAQESAEAGRYLAEARALELVLATAPSSGAETLAKLTDRILAAATGAEAQDIRPSAAPSGPPAKVVPINRAAPRPPVLRSQSASWQTAAALAASLVLGIGIGLTGVATTPVEAVAAAIGVDGNEQSTLVAASEEVLEDLL